MGWGWVGGMHVPVSCGSGVSEYEFGGSAVVVSVSSLPQAENSALVVSS